MGLLILGHPLSWKESKEHHAYVKKHGIEQFLALYRRYKDEKDAEFKWGDEVEYFVCNMDERSKTAKLPLRAPEILANLDAKKACDGMNEIIWHPEYANWMLEATPARPYGDNVESLVEAEANMILRRLAAQSFLQEGEHLFSMTCFPRMGTPNFTTSGSIVSSQQAASESIYIPDAAINPHPRFPTLTGNIRERRGEKVNIQVPVFQDEMTSTTLKRQRDHLQKVAPGNIEAISAANNSIYLDCMAFGMGSGCLQVTMQTRDIDEARLLYDQLAVVAPLMLALTAASPIWKGLLADTDARWDVISASVDDRDAVERGLAPAAGGHGLLPKSRYSSIDCFIARDPRHRDAYDDVPCAVDPASLTRLQQQGVDTLLARHVAHLFVRDPLVVFAERVGSQEAPREGDDEEYTDHFESLQSTNWNTVRFKPPPADPAAGIRWRVEFRSMELALTDFENAAHAAFVTLLARAIVELRADLYMPISLVDDNMQRAHTRGAAAAGTFWFRRDAAAAGDTTDPSAVGAEGDPVVDEMSLNDIFNGIGAFPGLLGLCRKYMDRAGWPAAGSGSAARARVDEYLELVAARAAGRLPTTAAWMRNVVLSHPLYARDSAVSERVAYDLLAACAAAQRGGPAAAGLLGSLALAAAGADVDCGRATDPAATAVVAAMASAGAAEERCWFSPMVCCGRDSGCCSAAGACGQGSCVTSRAASEAAVSAAAGGEGNWFECVLGGWLSRSIPV